MLPRLPRCFPRLMAGFPCLSGALQSRAGAYIAKSVGGPPGRRLANSRTRLHLLPSGGWDDGGSLQLPNGGKVDF